MSQNQIQTPAAPPSDDIFADLGLSPDALDFFAENLDEFVALQSTFMLRRNVETGFVAEINGHSIPCYATLRGGHLTRLSLQERTTQDDERKYLSANGMLSRVGIDVSAEVNGQRISITAFMTRWVNQARAKKGMTQLSVDEMAARLANMRMDYTGTMPLTWYHPGVNEESFRTFVDKVLSLGARDAMSDISDPRFIVESYDLTPTTGAGLSVLEMEIGSQDRSQSRRHQGFENFLSAQIEHFTNVVDLVARAKAIDAEVEEGSAKGTLTPSQVQERRRQIEALNEEYLSIRSRASWGGTQAGGTEAGDGSFVPNHEWYGVTIPSGRMRFEDPAGGEPIALDLWRPRSRANAGGDTSAGTTGVIDATKVATSERGKPSILSEGADDF